MAQLKSRVPMVCRLLETLFLDLRSRVTEPNSAAIARTTFRCELLSNAFGGILQAGFSTFALLLAIRAYGANEYEKAILAGAMSAGLLVAPVGLSLMRATRYSVNRLACGLMVFAGLCLLVVFSTQSLMVYVTGLAVAQIAIAQQPTLRIHVHTNNYSPSGRGRRLAWVFMVAGLSSIASSYGFGLFLDYRWDDYSWVFAIMALAAILCGSTLALIPTGRLRGDSQAGLGLRGSLRMVRGDKLFAIVLLGWMLLGLGWISTAPLRIEYLSAKEGLNMSNSQIALLTVAIPSLTEILFLRFFGGLFDRTNFVPFRIALNFFLIFSILLFFHGKTFSTLCIASIFTGLAFGGSSIAWSLWVTRLASPGKEAAYMSIHMALTGVRGMLAPFLGYYLLMQIGFEGAAWVAAGFLILSTFFFLGVRKNKRLDPVLVEKS
tara:strand:- start:1019 stop:2320 length:1302 start_codon:yes stop_codon:yes gene_type:complete